MKVKEETFSFYKEKESKRQLLIERKWFKSLFLTINQTICQK